MQMLKHLDASFSGRTEDMLSVCVLLKIMAVVAWDSERWVTLLGVLPSCLQKNVDGWKSIKKIIFLKKTNKNMCKMILLTPFLNVFLIGFLRH